MVSNTLKVSVTYTLRVVVRRKGLLNLDNTTKCNVQFRPLSGHQVCPCNDSALLRSVTWMGFASLEVTRHSSDAACDLPQYEPSVAFQVGVPSGKTIVPVNCIYREMAFVIPADLRQLFAVVRVRRIRIRLRAMTKAIIGSQTRTHTEFIDCFNIEGTIPLHLSMNESRITIPRDIWRNHTYPQVLPSFQLADIQRKYQLEVTVEFAWASISNAHVGTTAHSIESKITG